MILKKTESTQIKKRYRHRDNEGRYNTLYRVTIYWFLFIPVYSTCMIID